MPRPRPLTPNFTVTRGRSGTVRAMRVLRLALLSSIVVALACDGAQETSPGEIAGARPPELAGPDASASPLDASVTNDGPSGACEVPRGPDDDWRLVTKGIHLEDARGRRAFLRGVNAGGHAKLAPGYMPFDFTSATFDAALGAYLDRAAGWGIDVLRVPFNWAAVEPVRGQDDATYLARLDALVDGAWTRGIRVVLDFHQDVFAEAFCGDGFPAWTLAEPTLPAKRGCPLWFGEYTFDAGVKAAFDRFYADQDGIQTAYRALWDRMIARYKDRPGVIGFELLNEPGWGSANQAAFEATTLRDLYASMIARVNAAAPAALVFLDLPGTDGLTLSTTLPFPGGKNVVFAPHYYQASGLTGAFAVDTKKVAGDLAKLARVGAGWGVPTFFGEFGVHRRDAGARAFLEAHWQAFDATELHGTQWEYSVAAEGWNGESLGLVEANGSEIAPLVQALVRVYPRFVAGDAPRFAYEPATRTFTLDYAATVGGVSELAVPARLFPEGAPDVHVDGGCAAGATGIVRVIASKDEVHVRLTPRALDGDAHAN